MTIVIVVLVVAGFAALLLVLARWQRVLVTTNQALLKAERDRGAAELDGTKSLIDGSATRSRKVVGSRITRSSCRRGSACTWT